MEVSNPYSLRTSPEQDFLFEAEIPDGKDSLLSKYFKLSGAFTPLVLLLVVGAGILFWDKVNMAWLGCLLLLIPLNFWVMHQMILRLLLSGQIQHRKTSKLLITPRYIGVEDLTGHQEIYPYEAIARIKLVYGGYEQSWIPLSFRQKGSEPNEIHFSHQQKNISIPFRLFTQQGFFYLQNVIMMWQQEGVLFEEFNATAGLPIKSYLLETDEDKIRKIQG